MIGRRNNSRPVSRPGTSNVPALIVSSLLALAPPVVASPAVTPVLVDAVPVAFGPAAADTVPDGPSSEVYGRVLEHGGERGVGQATLLFRRLVKNSAVDSVSTSTGDDGAFRIDHLPSGIYALVTDHLSFDTRRDTFRVPVAKSMRIEISLSAEPVELRPLDVTVRAGWLVETGFFRRQRKGLGQFLTPEELEVRPVNNLTQALKTVPGVEWGRSCSNGFCREVLKMSISTGRANCPVKYFMDGDEMHSAVYARNISVQDLAAIEVYRNISETPPEFYGRCGSIVMWSKRAGS